MVFSIAETYHNKTSKNIPFLRTVTVHATAVGFQDKVREEDAATQPCGQLLQRIGEIQVTSTPYLRSIYHYSSN